MDILIKKKGASIQNRFLVPLDNNLVIGLLARESHHCPYCKKVIVVDVEGDKIDVRKSE